MHLARQWILLPPELEFDDERFEMIRAAVEPGLPMRIAAGGGVFAGMMAKETQLPASSIRPR